MALARLIFRRRVARGVTLFEVLVVVAILAVIASGVGIAAYDRWLGAQEKLARKNARGVRTAVKTWWIEHDSSTCPQVSQLIGDGTLDRDSPRRDPWGGDWHVECTGSEVTVISYGRDQQAGTEDDIRVPPT